LIIGSKVFLIVTGKETYGIILVNNSVVGKITPAVKTFFIDGTFSFAPQGFEQLQFPLQFVWYSQMRSKKDVNSILAMLYLGA
jgi:hypothetical protein